ncbi:zygote arrest protein 2.L-like isoform X1 [Narcine bancroftii]|uniref:zygote arrest protein 2.L-like isoform X1 n=1 Tax=Narcine bancroftii TaxID=1343680 RepID=UPI003831E06F
MERFGHLPSNAKPRQKPHPPGQVEAVDYFDNYKRAQLKAILSQVNPTLAPRLRKANTKEIGIQVNPKVDVSVQCSLGPRTLRPGNEEADVRGRAPSPTSAADAGDDPGVAGAASGAPAVARFSRPVAVSISSPAFNQCLGAKSQEPEGSGEEAAGREEQEAAAPERGDDASDGRAPEKEDPTDREGKSVEGKHRFRFQFLEQKYGYYHCKDCNIRWESAYVWCISGTNKVYFKQFCRKCDKGYNPYKVEAILCQACFENCCTCTQKKRHIDPKRPHRQQLCGRCRGKRLSCDNTYSFKYIV